MRVVFNLTSLSGPMLETFRLAVTALDKGIPVLASQVEEWLTDERERRLKAARGQACEPVEMVLPLLCEKELERGLAALTAFTVELEGLELEVAAEGDFRLAAEYKMGAAFSCAIGMPIAAQLRDLRAAAERPVN